MQLLKKTGLSGTLMIWHFGRVSIHSSLFFTPVFFSLLCLWCQSLMLLMFSNITVCHLWFSTLLTCVRTCSLFTQAMSFIVVSSLIKSVLMSSLFIILMNCSLRRLSFSLYSHSMALILSLHIYYSFALSVCLLMLQYCSDNMVTMQWWLKFYSI